MSPPERGCRLHTTPAHPGGKERFMYIGIGTLLLIIILIIIFT
jgi:hypothetical protein